MGAVACCGWARAVGRALLSALAYPALGLLLVTLLLAYSRGALVALMVGLVAVVLPGAAAPAWRSGAARPARSRPCRSRVGLLATTRSAPKACDRRRHLGGPRARRAFAAMVVLLTLVGVAIVVRDRPPRAPARAAPPRREGAAGAAGSRRSPSRGARRQPPRPHGHDLPRLPLAHRHPRQSPNTPGRLTAIASVRAQYWDEALKVFKAHPGARRRRRGLRNRAAALPHRDRCRSNTRTASSCRRSPTSASSGLRWRSRCWLLDGRGGPRHASVQPALAQLARAARAGCARHGARSTTGERRPTAPERIGLLTHALPGRRLRRPLADRLDLVRAGRRVRGAAVRRLAGRTRAAAQTGARPGAGTGPPWIARRRCGRAARFGRLGRPSSGAHRASRAAAVVAGAARRRGSQWQPQRSEETREAALAQLASDPAAALADGAQRGLPRPAVGRSAVHARRRAEQRPAGRAGARDARAGRCGCSRRTRRPGWSSAASTSTATRRRRRELRAAIYLNPGSISRGSAPDGRRSDRDLQRLRPGAARVPSGRRPSKARPDGAREQNRAAPGGPPARRSMLLEAEVLEQPTSVAAV